MLNRATLSSKRHGGGNQVAKEDSEEGLMALAEREGFEPSDPHYQVNSLAVSPIRPLWHLSVTHHCRTGR